VIGDARDWVESNARRFGAEPALEDVDDGDVLTWAQLEDRVARVAGMLSEQFGVGRGDRVLVLAEGDPRVFEVMFACMRLGAIMVPLNWRLTPVELTELCVDTEPTLVIHDPVWQDVALTVGAAAGVTASVGWRCTDAALDYDTAVEKATPVRASLSNRLSDPALILHTSGTTGTPKGAIATAGTMTWQTFNTAQEALITGPGVKQLNPLPLFHAGGLTTVAAPILRSGGCVGVLRRFDPEQVAAALCDPSRGFTHWTAPPVMHQAVASTSQFGAGDLSAVRYAQVAGGVPSLALLEQWRERGVVLQQAYGGTELGPAVTTMNRDAVAGRPTSCGRAVPFTHVRLVGDDDADVADGEVGEVWIAGPSVTTGYWRRPVGTGFTDDGWFRTGDAARRDDEGYYYLVDRLKDMYKSGGENVYPAEVERVLADHPDVVEVAVVGVADEQWGEVGRAFVVARTGATVTLDSLAAHCEGRLARYKLPKSVVVVEGALPRNTTGKVPKADLRHWPS
jgi:fatty-acyl-CoA synthase